MQNSKTRTLRPFNVLLTLFLLGGLVAVAQTDDAGTDAPSPLDIEQISYFLDGPATLPSTENNEIFIQQIGLGNQAHVTTVTQSSEITLEQNGSNNKTILDVNAKTYVGHLVQNGSSNVFIENTNAPSLGLERNVAQEGNNHNVLIYGTNDITKNIKLNLQGSAKTIIIRNFQ